MYKREQLLFQKKNLVLVKNQIEREKLSLTGTVFEKFRTQMKNIYTEIENKNKNSFDELRNLIFKKSLRRKIKIIKIQYAADSNILISFAEITSLFRFVILFFWNLIGVAPI